MEGYVEYGYVNTVNAANGTVTVMQPDKGGYISGEIPFFSHCGEFKLPEVGAMVAIVKWGKGSSNGVVLGEWWSPRNPAPEGYDFYKDTGGGTSISSRNGQLTLSDSGGSITVKELIEKISRI